MTGRHDRADQAGLLRTGPIVVRGLTRGVRDAVRSGRTTRHRSPARNATGDARGEAGPSTTIPSDGDTAVGREEDHAVGADEREQDVPDEPAAAAVDEDAAAPPEDERSAAAPAAAAGRPDGAADPTDAGWGDQRGAQVAGRRAGVGEPVRTVRPLRPGLRAPAGRERVGIAVLAVLAVVCVALVVAVMLKTQRDAALAAAEAAAYTPPPLVPAAPAAAASVSIIGDDGLTAAARGVAADSRWPALLDDRLSGGVRSLARPGAGYTVEGEDGGTFVDAAQDLPKASRAVVVVGGAADAGATPLALARAASRALSDAAVRAPDARLVVVGPLYRPEGVSTGQLTAVRDVLRTAAALAEATWIDPIGSRWSPGVRSGADLTAARLQTIADRMATALGSVPATAG